MAFQYSGTIIHRAFTPATRQDIVSNITQALLDAGWTTISGTPGSGADVIQQSAANNLGSLIRLRSQDLGGATVSAKFSIKHPLGTTGDSAGLFLNPANTYRIIATSHFLAAFQAGNANTLNQRSSLFAGTLYIPSFLGIPSGDACGFIIGQGTTDSDAGGRYCWRVAIQAHGANSLDSLAASMMGSNLRQGTTGGPDTCAYLARWQGGDLNFDYWWRWEDNTPLAYEALFSLSNPLVGTGIHGQLYDCALINGGGTGETTFSMDNHTWMWITNGYGSGGSFMNQTAGLAVAIT